jgi:putative nucleotidyltransferase with HDIG domain
LAGEALGYQWFVLAGLTLLSGSFTVRIPTIPARLSVSETFVFAAAILFGPPAATVIVVLDTLIISLWLRKTSKSASRVLFNLAAPATAIWTASHVFFRLANIQPLSIQPQPILSLVVPILTLALIYFLLNSWLIALAVGFEKHGSAFRVWKDNFFWLSLNYFSGASVAALLLPYLQEDQRAFLRIASILLPLLIISYLTFKTALGRVDDANRHLSELNRLYLSTIETLAMAIDAKDQITHGHIRRVQHYAVGLAKRLGVTDLRQIQAIEAASLLHDMGKLAVPEYILNKPGKLTAAEFDKMKLHASVGADILSSIEFPYPVVPIVRHHHENWDGTGYPDGLKGSDIPIGARILSVVDCYDALTSDRPYRPRLSDAEAINILGQRRGSMYDPLVVDTFISVYLDIAPPTEPSDKALLLAPLSREARSEKREEPGSGLDNIAASTEEMMVLFELARTISAQTKLETATEQVAKHLRRVMPASTCVVYIHDSPQDELVAVGAAGEHADRFMGLRIQRGQRLTGWVAANRRTILNSDPILDLGEIARTLKPRLQSCLSTPIVHNDELAGVLSLYSVQSDAFDEDHRRIAEAVARQISVIAKQAMLKGGVVSEGLSTATAWAIRVQDQTYLTSENLSIALLGVRDPHLGSPESITELLVPITEQLRSALRTADVLLKVSGSEIVILLAQTNGNSARRIGSRIASEVQKLRRQSHGTALTRVMVTLGVATSPEDGTDIDALIAAARRSAQRVEGLTRPQESIH